MGKAAYLVTYSILSILVFGWLIVATSRAPYLPLWQAALWQAWIPNTLMPFVCLLLAACCLLWQRHDGRDRRQNKALQRMVGLS